MSNIGYTDEMVSYIEDNRFKLNVNQMCKSLKINFDKDVTPKALRKYYYRHNLDFKKMVIQRQNCTIKHPIGTESNPDKNGLVRIKINDKQWVYKQRYIYEQHYGKIPKGYKVIFLNGDKTDYDINNLAIAPYKDILYIYGNNLNSSDREVTRLSLKVAHLENKIIEKRGEGKYGFMGKKSR